MDGRKVWEIPISGDFLDYLYENKPGAYKLYSQALRGYVRWLRSKFRREREVDELTLEDLKPMYVESFLSRYKNSYTFNAYLSAFRSLARFAQKELIPTTVEEFMYLHRFVAGIDMIKDREVPKYFSREALSEEELEELLVAVAEDEMLFSATVVHFYFGARPIELAQRYVEVKLELNRVGELVKRHGRAMVDFESCIVCMPVAKTRTRVKVLPFRPIADHFELWLSNIDEVLKYARGRANEWYTKHIKPYSERLGFPVTAKTGRKTFETMMRMRGVEQWKIDYWLGHSTSIPDIYTDYNLLLPEIEKSIVGNHYLLEVLERF